MVHSPQHHDSRNAMLVEAVWPDKAAAPFVLDACEDTEVDPTQAESIDLAKVSWLCKFLTSFAAEVIVAL